MPKEILEKKESELEKFEEEMQRIKERELAKKEKGENYDAHWDDIEPADLKEEDMIICKKYQKEMPLKQLLKDFEEYREQFLKAQADDSRSNFCAWLANKINKKSIAEQMKET